MKTKEIGKLIKLRRKSLGLTQVEVAFACGLGGRFISDLENGKESCQVGKVLLVLESIGLDIRIDERKG
ncbi:helix-turn-helix transcriptional regulator [bacterium]|nr:helix-turn-helix transcriptional regulator [bacterium]